MWGANTPPTAGPETPPTAQPKTLYQTKMKEDKGIGSLIGAIPKAIAGVPTE